MASSHTRIQKGACWNSFTNPEHINTYKALLSYGEVLKDRGRRQKGTPGHEFHRPKLDGVKSGVGELRGFTEDKCLYWATGRKFDAWVIQDGCEQKLEELGLTIPEGIGEIRYPTSRAIIVAGNRGMSFQGDGFRYASFGSQVIAPPTRFDFADGFKAEWVQPLSLQNPGLGNPDIVHTLAKHQYEQAGKYLPLSFVDQQQYFPWDRNDYEQVKAREFITFVNNQALGVTGENAKYFLQYMSFAVFLNSSQSLKTSEDIKQGFIQITQNHAVFHQFSPVEVLEICSESFTRVIAYRLFNSNISNSS